MRFSLCLSLVLLSIISCTKVSVSEKEGSRLSLSDGDDQRVNKKRFHSTRSTDPKTLDPQAQFDEVSGSMIQSIYDTLVVYHYLKRPYSLQESLIEKMPTVSEDKKKYTFYLKKGIFFQDDPCFKNGDGKELTADDVLYTIKRFADINVNTQSWFLLDEVIEGLDKFRELTQTLGKNKVDYDKHQVSGLKKLDKYSFEIRLKKKNPLFLYSLAASSLSIVAKEAIETYGRDFSRHPVGTGPYRLEKYKKKQTMVLVKNPNYFLTYPVEGTLNDKKQGFLEDKGKKLPLIDEVHVHYIPEAQPQMLKFKKGELSWIGLDRDNFDQMAYMSKDKKIHLKGDLAKKYSVYTEPGLSASYLVFNLKDTLIGNNKNLRKAIAYAFDVEKKIELLGNGRAFKLNTIVPLTIEGSERDIGEFGYPYSLEKARYYLKKAGFPNGKGLPTITLTLSGSSTGHKRYYEFVRNSLGKVGIQLAPEYKTWPSFLKATERGDFQMTASAWAADYPDPENFYQLYYGPNKPPGQNSSSFDHPEYNMLYEQIRFMEDSSERLTKIKRMAKILQEEVPVIFDSTPIVSGLIQKWVGNFKRNIMISKPYMYLDIDLKKQQTKL